MRHRLQVSVALITCFIAAFADDKSRHLQDGEELIAQTMGPPLWVKLGGSIDKSAQSERDREVLQGLTLFAEVVNATRPFVTADGRPVLLNVDLNDDGGDTATSRTIYGSLLTENSTSVNALIGPTSDDAIAEVLQLASDLPEESHAPLIFHQALLEEPRPVGGFSVGIPANELLNHSLVQLRALGAQQAFFAWPATDWAQTVCQAGVEMATSLGFTVNSFTGDVESSAFYIQAANQASEANPDIYVGCGADVDAILSVINLVALDVNPAAVLLTNSISPGFHAAVGTLRANYIFGPVAWTHEVESGNCRVFGSSAAFNQQYQNLYDTSPTEHAAQAIAVAYAVLLAVEHSGSVNTADLYNALEQIDENRTFYGRLKFDARGFLEEKVGRTKQIQPLPDTMPQRLRYTDSLFVVIDGAQVDSDALWPSPTWTVKELEIYPCADGYELNITDLESVSCAPCAVGTHRPYVSVTCRPCGVGFFSDVEGLVECKVCPVGADCYLGQTTGVPPAQPGYYRLGSSSPYRYEGCEPSKVCLADNTCMGKNAGTLCSKCEPGFSNKGVFTDEEGVCTECPHPIVNFLLMSVGVIINLAHMAVAAWLTHTAATRIFELHAVVFKLFMEYAHLMTVTLMGLDVTYLSPRIYHSVLQSPVSLLQSLNCIFGDMVDSRAAAVYTGWGILPFVLASNLVLFAGVIAISFRCFKRENRAVQARKAQERPMKRRQQAQQEDEPFVNKNTKEDDDIVEKSAKEKDAVAMLSSDSSEDENQDEGDSSSDSELEELPDMKVQWHRFQYMFNHFICWNTVWVFLLYPVQVSMLLEPLRCVELGTLRLEMNMDVDCDSEEHWRWMYGASAGLVVYGVGIPLSIGILLFKFRYKLDHVGVRRSLGFWFNGFSRSHYYYEVVHMARKGSLIMVVSSPVMFVRTAAMLFVMVAFLAIEVQVRPYDNRDFGVLLKLEELMSVSIISTILTRLFHILRKDIGSSVFASTANSWVVDFTISAVCLLLHMVFLCWIGWLMFRDFFLKPGSYKALLMPRWMTLTERLLQKLERNANRVKYDPRTQNFNLQALSAKELDFFTKLVCDTMDCYVKNIHNFHPGFVVTALKEAVSLCIRDRRRRALELSDQFTIKKKVKRWKILRKIDRLMESLNYIWKVLEDEDVGAEDEVLREAQEKEKAHSAVEKTNREVRELRRMKQCRKDAMSAASTSTATTEELYNALMLCWPDIAEHRQRFYAVDKMTFDATATAKGDGGEEGEFDTLQLSNKPSANDGLAKAQKLLGVNSIGDGVDAVSALEANSLAQPQEILRQHAKLEIVAAGLREEIEKLVERITNAEDEIDEVRFGPAVEIETESPQDTPPNSLPTSPTLIGKVSSLFAPATPDATKSVSRIMSRAQPSPTLRSENFKSEKSKGDSSQPTSSEFGSKGRTSKLSSEQSTTPAGSSKRISASEKGAPMPSTPSGRVSTVGSINRPAAGGPTSPAGTVALSASVRGKKKAEGKAAANDGNVAPAHLSTGFAAFLGLQRTADHNMAAQAKIEKKEFDVLAELLGSDPEPPPTSVKTASRHPPPKP